MLTLSAGELVQMRATADTALPGTAILLVPTDVSDSQGGFTRTYAASGTVAARLAYSASKGGEPAVAGRIAEVSPWILTIPAATTITEVYRVQYDSVTYEVDEVLTWIPWEISRRVRLSEVD